MLKCWKVYSLTLLSSLVPQLGLKVFSVLLYQDVPLHCPKQSNKFNKLSNFFQLCKDLSNAKNQHNFLLCNHQTRKKTFIKNFPNSIQLKTLHFIIICSSIYDSLEKTQFEYRIFTIMRHTYTCFLLFLVRLIIEIWRIFT